MPIEEAPHPSLTDLKSQGLTAYQQGLYAKSAQAFLGAVDADPKDWQAYENLGNCYYKLNRWKKALEAYRQSLAIHPDNPTLGLLVEQLQKEAEILNSGVSPSAGFPAPVPSSLSTPPKGADSFGSVKSWFRLEGGYNNSGLGDFKDSAAAFNRNLSGNGYTGSVLQSNDGSVFGLELGFQVCPFNGLALGFHYLRTADYGANFSQPGTTPLSFEDETLQPHVVGFTLDDYWFLNDKGGRFFLGMGVGYYEGTVHLEERYDFTSGGGGAANFVGDLNSGNVGFQVSLGREWVLNPDMALSFFARGRVVRITYFRGNVVNADGSTAQFGLERGPDGTLDVDDVSNIGANGEKYATLDFTGFDLMAALVLYSY
jgi:hypothetical protein